MPLNTARLQETRLLKIYAISEGKFVNISITDNGTGINLKLHGNKLFGMYKTFHGNTDARGVGLFFTKNQIEAMGGKLKLKSQLTRAPHL